MGEKIKREEEGGRKVGNRKKILVLMLFFSFVVSGCSNKINTFNQTFIGPQVIVNPEEIHLGVVRLRDTNITFEGMGFTPRPGDSILIILYGPRGSKIIAAEAPINTNGTFKASVSMLTKMMEFLKADILMDEHFKQVVLIKGPPVPQGIYTVKAMSMLGKQSAETKLTILGPTLIDSFKDWIGRLSGKIKYSDHLKKSL